MAFSKIIFFVFVGVNSIMLVKSVANIKIIKGRSIHFSDSIFDTNLSCSKGVKSYNETYSVYPTRWVVKKDFPKDTKYRVDITRTAKDGTKDQLESVLIKLCDLNDIHREYLPDFLIDLTADGNCIKKGDYSFDYAGQFKIEKLLKHSDIDGFTFTERICIFSSAGIIRNVEFDSIPV